MYHAMLSRSSIFSMCVEWVSKIFLHPTSATGVIVLMPCVCPSVCPSHSPGQTNEHKKLKFGMEVKCRDMYVKFVYQGQGHQVKKRVIMHFNARFRSCQRPQLSRKRPRNMSVKPTTPGVLKVCGFIVI